jgi:hypothetical protein
LFGDEVDGPLDQVAMVLLRKNSPWSILVVAVMLLEEHDQQHQAKDGSFQVPYPELALFYSRLFPYKTFSPDELQGVF